MESVAHNTTVASSYELNEIEITHEKAVPEDFSKNFHVFKIN